jgi:hypothetical protein
VMPGVLARGVVAAADVPAGCAAPQMKPPARGRTGQAVGASRSARWRVGVDLAVSCCHISVSFLRLERGGSSVRGSRRDGAREVAARVADHRIGIEQIL